LLKRTYDYDVLKCKCGGRLKAVELVTEAGRTKELLEQFGMSTKLPVVATFIIRVLSPPLVVVMESIQYRKCGDLSSSI
jgi:hypothetical protein